MLRKGRTPVGRGPGPPQEPFGQLCASQYLSQRHKPAQGFHGPVAQLHHHLQRKKGFSAQYHAPLHDAYADLLEGSPLYARSIQGPPSLDPVWEDRPGHSRIEQKSGHPLSKCIGAASFSLLEQLHSLLTTSRGSRPQEAAQTKPQKGPKGAHCPH